MSNYFKLTNTLERKSFFGLFVLGFIIFFSSSAMAQQLDEEKLDALLTQTNNYFKLGYYNQALEIREQVLAHYEMKNDGEGVAYKDI